MLTPLRMTSTQTMLYVKSPLYTTGTIVSTQSTQTLAKDLLAYLQKPPSRISKLKMFSKGNTKQSITCCPRPLTSFVSSENACRMSVCLV